jgi:cohesin complex subunit SA-1/2
MVRGAQLSVVGRLENKYVVDIHISLLTWIGKRLGTYENNGNKQLRNTAVEFFKVLLQLLSTIDSRDALKM